MGASPPDAGVLPGVEDAVALGLTRAEYELICDKLGRAPNQVELAMFSLLWSEHCAYKHSKKLLRTLPTEGRHVLMGPGENAGAVDVGGGLACAFKVESHNHPSAVEPFQGAATGVGGILRDIFAIGARPIAVLDSLRFGDPETSRALALPARRRGRGHRPLRQLDRRADDRRRGLLRGAVRAELPRQRDGARARRERDRLMTQRGRGRRATCSSCSAPRPAATASAARRCSPPPSSARPTTDKRPTVQVGDPFEEKKLHGVLARAARARAARLAAGPRRGRPDLERVRDGLQGRGRDRHRRRPRAAARGGHGAVRDHGLASRRSGCSASCEPARLDEVLAVCETWEVHGDGDRRGHRHRPHARVRRRAARRRHAGRARSSTTARCTTSRRRSPTQPLYPPPPPLLAPDVDADARRCSRCCARPNIASRRPLFEQYDCDRAVAHRAPARRRPTRPCCCCRDGSRRSRVSIDGNGRRVAADPYRGTVEAVLECAANLACVGRRAARHDEQPQLRQPREAARRVAAHRGGARPRRRVPRARDARSSAATCRSTTRARRARSTRRR